MSDPKPQTWEEPETVKRLGIHGRLSWAIWANYESDEDADAAAYRVLLWFGSLTPTDQAAFVDAAQPGDPQ